MGSLPRPDIPEWGPGGTARAVYMRRQRRVREVCEARIKREEAFERIGKIAPPLVEARADMAREVLAILNGEEDES